MNVAKIILSQLGGNQFALMTGSRNFVALSNDKGLRMKLAKNMSGAQYLDIILNEAQDLYEMVFFKVNPRKAGIEIINKQDGLFFDMLQSTFTEVTGLDTVMPTIYTKIAAFN